MIPNIVSYKEHFPVNLDLIVMFKKMGNRIDFFTYHQRPSLSWFLDSEEEVKHVYNILCERHVTRIKNYEKR